jgi:hypothetical protein
MTPEDVAQLHETLAAAPSIKLQNASTSAIFHLNQCGSVLQDIQSGLTRSFHLIG